MSGRILVSSWWLKAVQTAAVTITKAMHVGSRRLMRRSQ